MPAVDKKDFSLSAPVEFPVNRKDPIQRKWGGGAQQLLSSPKAEAASFPIGGLIKLTLTSLTEVPN